MPEVGSDATGVDTGTSPRRASVRVLALVAVVVVALGGVLGLSRLDGLGGPSVGGNDGPTGATTGSTSLTSGDQEALAIGQSAPPLRASAVTGAVVNLADLRGRPVWLAFGASWCAPCRAEAADIEALWREQRATGLDVIAVHVGEDAAAARAFGQDVGFTLAQIADPDRAIAGTYRAVSIPMHVFIDRSGVVRSVRYGTLTRAQMSDELARITPASPASSPRS